MVALFDGAGLDALQVAAGAGLGHRDRGDEFTGAELGQPPLLLLLVGQPQQIWRDDVVVQAEPDAAVAARDGLLGDDHVVAEVGIAAAAVLLGHRHTEEALLAGLQPHPAVDDLVLLPLLVVRRDVAVQERAVGLAEQIVFGLEQGALVFDDAAHGFDLRELVRAVDRRRYPIQPDGWSTGRGGHRRRRRRGPKLASMAHAPTSLTHWGASTPASTPATSLRDAARPGDTDPSPLLGNLPGAIRHRSRIATARPSDAAGCDDGPGPSDRRGADEFVAVSWDDLTELLAGELRRVVDTHGNEAIYGGSYGWASAGRFHHAQSQVHRFLKLLGGYTFSRHSYSLGATGVIMPRVVGTHDDLFKRSTNWDGHRRDTPICWCASAAPALKNTGSQPRRHHGPSGPRRAAPVPRPRRTHRVVRPAARRRRRATASGWPRCRAPMWRSCWRWPTCWPPNPWPTATSSTTYCTGYDRSSATCWAPTTASPKSPEWASKICGLPADTLRALARRMAAGRTLVTVSWSLQRVRHGEQAPWMGLTLAAMLGQIGLPGGGFGHGYGSMNEPGLPPLRCRLPAFPQGPNPVTTFIPVAAVSDMLLHPGEPFDYNGQRLTYPGHPAACTGPAATRSTTTRTFPGCGARWPGRHRRGTRPVLDGDGQARRHRRAVDHAPTNATTTPAPATTRC